MSNSGLIETSNGTKISYDIWCDILSNLPQPTSKVPEPINTVPIDICEKILDDNTEDTIIDNPIIRTLSQAMDMAESVLSDE
tara:strand:- start:113 stop:358 length:246 start_codon:yes stop_codon:yes gene_type:complete